MPEADEDMSSLLTPILPKQIKMEIDCVETVDGQLQKTNFDTENQSDYIPEFGKQSKQKKLLSPMTQNVNEFFIDDGSCDKLEVCQALAGGMVMWCREKISDNIQPLSPSEVLADFCDLRNARETQDLNISSKNSHKSSRKKLTREWRGKHAISKEPRSPSLKGIMKTKKTKQGRKSLIYVP